MWLTKVKNRRRSLRWDIGKVGMGRDSLSRWYRSGREGDRLSKWCGYGREDRGEIGRVDGIGQVGRVGGDG